MEQKKLWNKKNDGIKKKLNKNTMEQKKNDGTKTRWNKKK